jgi:hypothetical protein
MPTQYEAVESFCLHCTIAMAMLFANLCVQTVELACDPAKAGRLVP